MRPLRQDSTVGRRDTGQPLLTLTDLAHVAELGRRASMGRRRAMSPDERHTRMAAIHRENTRPEVIVRRILWRLGARYRLHARELPGKPDVVMRRVRKPSLSMAACGTCMRAAWVGVTYNPSCMATA